MVVAASLTGSADVELRSWSNQQLAEDANHASYGAVEGLTRALALRKAVALSSRYGGSEKAQSSSSRSEVIPTVAPTAARRIPCGTE